MIKKLVELVQNKPELFISNYLENYFLKEYFDDYSLDSTIQDLFPYLTILHTFKSNDSFNISRFISDNQSRIKKEQNDFRVLFESLCPDICAQQTKLELELQSNIDRLKDEINYLRAEYETATSRAKELSIEIDKLELEKKCNLQKLSDTYASLKKIESRNKELEKENKKLKFELEKVSSAKNEQNGNVSPHGNPINPSRFSSIFEAANYVSQKEAIPAKQPKKITKFNIHEIVLPCCLYKGAIFGRDDINKIQFNKRKCYDLLAAEYGIEISYDIFSKCKCYNDIKLQIGRIAGIPKEELL